MYLACAIQRGPAARPQIIAPIMYPAFKNTILQNTYSHSYREQNREKYPDAVLLKIILLFT